MAETFTPAGSKTLTTNAITDAAAVLYTADTTNLIYALVTLAQANNTGAANAVVDLARDVGGGGTLVRPAGPNMPVNANVALNLAAGSIALAPNDVLRARADVATVDMTLSILEVTSD